MAYFLQASLLVLLLLLQTPANSFAKSVEDSDLASLLEELEVDRISKREEQNQVNDRSFTKEDPGSLFSETSMDFPENVIDNVDHMKEERKLSGLDHIEDTITKDNDKTPVDTLYEPVGCYRDKGNAKRPLPVLLANLRSHIDWHNLKRTIRACARLAQAKGYRYFGIQFYGECWSGPTADQTYDQDGSSDSCVAGVGKTWANFVYRFKEDECSNYTELSTADRAETNDNRVYTCDNTLTKGWYRFTGQAGTHMATKCVPRFHCGTHAPGWMSGTLPSAAEGIVNRKVCFNWRNDCCFWKTNSLVKNCGKYYVYRLEKPPHCRLKYCGSVSSDTSNYPEVIPREVTELLPGTEMDLFLSNGNDEVLDEYEPVGCYRDRGGDHRPLPVLLANLRPSIDWKDLNKTIRACATLAQAKGYRYFGIQFYGECWSGPTADQTYDQDGSSDSCVAGVGKAWANFVYRFKEDEKTTVSPATTVTPSPECSSYIELSTADRAETNDNRVYTCDNTLTKGWYRFTGQAGTHMSTKCVPRFHCGTHAPGWMSGTLPSAAEGIVNRKVCFNWRNDCCYWKTQVRVKNCGGFYVYAFQKPPVCRLGYCGSNKALPTPATPTTVESTTTKPSTPRPTTVRPSTKRPTTVQVTTIKQDECTIYRELDTADRAETYGPKGVFKCDDALLPGWYRFTGKAGNHMATKCAQLLHCGTHSPGWMSGTLPSVAEGIVKRGVCFNWNDDCCHYNTTVLVRNCGGFYVYNLQKPPLCRLRYCGSNNHGTTVSPNTKPTTSRPTTSRPTTRRPTTRRPMTRRPTTRRPTTVESTTRPTTSRPTTKRPTTVKLTTAPIPLPIQTFRLCEHRSGVLRCPSGEKIKIRYANYGRTTGRSVCPHPSIRTMKCYSSVAANLVRCACNGHNSCPLYAKNQVYGDPCVGTFKYIEVKYQCVA